MNLSDDLNLKNGIILALGFVGIVLVVKHLSKK